MEIGIVRPVDIEDEMKGAYLDYAMSVITARALPDVRDGLKPVQRRILYAMFDMGLRYDRPHKKSARIVGEVLGKYHPHGDSAVYDAMVCLAQDFSMRYLLVDGQGNFGSVDGDPPAAMRYTEARLARIAEEMVADIGKNTVDFYPNFDETLKQPSVLPANLPNLLLNGTAGIAVGMATNIPPHNLNEIADACIYLIDNWERIEDVNVDDLLKFVHGPDFPTGATILGIEGIRNAYATGRGRVVMRAKAHIEDIKGNRQRIVITELPYQVNKATLIERIAELVRNRKIDTISDLRDESDRRGMSVVIELKRGANPKTTLNQLLKHTQLQGTFGVNMLALVNGEPKVLPLKRALELWIEHRREVIRRRTEYDLERARARAHILEGLRIALEYLDEVIAIIRKSQTRDTARQNLVKRFKLTDIQATAILDMQLGRLAALERKKIEDEYKEVIQLIGYLEDLLRNPRKVLQLIRNDLKDLKQRYGDARRTRILAEEGENFSDEDLIPNQDVLISLTQRGYIKRVAADAYRTQRRGGRGITGMVTREEDVVQDMRLANTHDNVLFFTDKGRVFQIKTHLLPEADRTAKGMPLVNFIGLDKGEAVTAMLSVPSQNGAHYLVMATRKGKIKRTQLSEFEAVRPSGIIALTLEDGDALGWVRLTDGTQDILMISANGQALRFSEDEVRPMGRTAAGVNAMRIDSKDEIACMAIARPDHELLIVTRDGYAKRTPIAEYPTKGRATGGVRTLDVNKLAETGPIVAGLIVNPDDEIAIISRDGVVMRTEIKGVKQAGRPTRGSKVMTLKKSDVVASVTNLTPRLSEEKTAAEAPTNGQASAAGAKATTSPPPPVDEGSQRRATTAKPKATAEAATSKAAPDADAVLTKPSATQQVKSIANPKQAKQAEQQALDALKATTDDRPPTTRKAATAKTSPEATTTKSVNAVKLSRTPKTPPSESPPPARPAPKKK